MHWPPPVSATVLALALVGHQAVVAVQNDVAVDVVGLRLAMVVLAAAAAFTFDDPADGTVASTPIPRWQRRSVRLALAVAAWAGGWMAMLAVASFTPAPLPVAPLSLEAFGWLSAALAVAAVSHSTAAVPAMLVAYVVAHRLPHRFSLVTDPGGPAWNAVRDRWLGVIGTAVLVVVLSNRDPAHRRARLHWSSGHANAKAVRTDRGRDGDRGSEVRAGPASEFGGAGDGHDAEGDVGGRGRTGDGCRGDGAPLTSS